MILASAHVAADDDEAILVKSLGAAKVSLQDGFAASERQGQPVSGKFEAEEGKLQLSVYTAKDGKYYEVIVDHMTGAIAKVEPITEGDDLAHAKSQMTAMEKAKVKLMVAAARAREQAGAAIAVSAVPELQSGRAVAVGCSLEGRAIVNRFDTARLADTPTSSSIDGVLNDRAR
ncbi:hypothetical protein E3H11_36700 [Bradyrhizobium brasilense]|nr:hypothetical protein [Bradyrhizobium brasilense]